MRELKNGIWLVHTKAGSHIEIEVKDGLWRLHGKHDIFLTDRTTKELLAKGHKFEFVRNTA